MSQTKTKKIDGPQEHAKIVKMRFNGLTYKEIKKRQVIIKITFENGSKGSINMAIVIT